MGKHSHLALRDLESTGARSDGGLTHDVHKIHPIGEFLPELRFQHGVCALMGENVVDGPDRSHTLLVQLIKRLEEPPVSHQSRALTVTATKNRGGPVDVEHIGTGPRHP